MPTTRKAARRAGTQPTFDLLSDELLLEIFAALDVARHLASCASVSNAWCTLASDEGLWLRLVKAEYGTRPPVFAPIKTSSTMATARSREGAPIGETWNVCVGADVGADVGVDVSADMGADVGADASAATCATTAMAVPASPTFSTPPHAAASAAASSSATALTVVATPPPRPTAATVSESRRLFAELQLAGRAALLLGEIDYVGFYEETLLDGTYTLGFWLRAWPTRLSPIHDTAYILGSNYAEHTAYMFGDPRSIGLEGIANYVYLNPPPEHRTWEDHLSPRLGQWGGEAFRALWNAPERSLRGFRSELVAGVGPGAPADVDRILGHTPSFHLQLSPNGHEVCALPSFRGNGVEDVPVRVHGMLRAGAEPVDVLRALRPKADLTGLPPGDTWRPRRRNRLACVRDAAWAHEHDFSGFDAWPRAASRSARLQAALARWRTPVEVASAEDLAAELAADLENDAGGAD